MFSWLFGWYLLLLSHNMYEISDALAGIPLHNIIVIIMLHVWHTWTFTVHSNSHFDVSTKLVYSRKDCHTVLYKCTWRWYICFFLPSMHSTFTILSWLCCVMSFKAMEDGVTGSVTCVTTGRSPGWCEHVTAHLMVANSHLHQSIPHQSLERCDILDPDDWELVLKCTYRKCCAWMWTVTADICTGNNDQFDWSLDN